MTVGEVSGISDPPITTYLPTLFIAIHKYKEKVRGVEMVGNNRRITDFTDSTD